VKRSEYRLVGAFLNEGMVLVGGGVAEGEQSSHRLLFRSCPLPLTGVATLLI
jgi:hypothetical protein